MPTGLFCQSIELRPEIQVPGPDGAWMVFEMSLIYGAVRHSVTDCNAGFWGASKPSQHQ